MLRRSDFTRGRLDQIASQAGFIAPTDAELADSRAAVLSGRPAGDLWIFAYGSLMWNPAVSVIDTRPARLRGWQRSFCIDLPGGRGTPEQPGLMCALVPGGSCSGLAHRIAAACVESETVILWMREMAFGAYVASLLPVVIDGKVVEGMTFAADAARVLRLPLDEQARRIAVAEGPIGTNREYLFRLQQSLAEYRLADAYISALGDRIRTFLQDTDQPEPHRPATNFG
jgi:cation transport protein ChaC